MDSTKYWVWLSSQTQVSVRSRAALIEHYGSAKAAFFAPKGEYCRIRGISARDAQELERRDTSAVAAIFARCRAEGLQIVTMQDALYPQRLKNIYAPPVVLYVKGKLPQIDERAAISVIGTRKATAYGLKMARKLAYEITKCGALVVAGYTAGIDSAALRAALDAQGECIAVLGVPHELEKGELARRIGEHGALISEYPPGTKPYKSYFRARNRISAGISVGVVAVEAPEKSGVSLFITEATEQGREIFAVPGNADSATSVGTNGFIRDGAKPVTCGWDILCEFERRFSLVNCPCTVPPETEQMPAATVRTSVMLDSRQQKSSRRKAPEGSSAPSGAQKEAPPSAKATVVYDKSQQKAVDKESNTGYSDLSERIAELPPDQRSILSAITHSLTPIDEIIEATGLTAARTLAQLSVLEIKGLIKKHPGGRISLTIQ